MKKTYEQPIRFLKPAKRTSFARFKSRVLANAEISYARLLLPTGLALVLLTSLTLICTANGTAFYTNPNKVDTNHKQSSSYPDIAFEQDYSIRYNTTDSTTILKKIVSDRNGNILILSDKGILKPHAGKLLYPGTLVNDLSYHFITDMKINGLTSYDDQFVYLDDKTLFSNAWAGTINYSHQLPGASIITAGKDFYFLISNGKQYSLLHKDQQEWTGRSAAPVINIQYQPSKNLFWCLTDNSLSYFSPLQKRLITIFTGEAL